MLGRTNAITGSSLQIPLDAPTNLAVSASNAKASITWTDPLDKYAVSTEETPGAGEQLVSQWAYTKIIRKIGSQPTGPNDGTPVLETTTRNQYQSTAYVDQPLVNDTTYYYAAYAYNTDGVVSDGCFASGVTPKAFDPVLENNTWEQISDVSTAGSASSAWAVGDTHSILINGTVGTRSINQTLYVFIIGFDHNASVEGSGVTFHGFKTAASGGRDVCLVGSNYGNASYTSGDFIMKPADSNNGGWASSNMRSHCLGSANASSPTANTLMSALPTDLRAYMKPMTIWTNNAVGTNNTASASTDYLPLLSEYEIFGTTTYSCAAEAQHQQQYTYYSSGNSKIKYRHDSTSSAAYWWERSPYSGDAYGFCRVHISGNAGYSSASWSSGVAPAFRI